MKINGYAIVDALEEWIKAREAYVRAPKVITSEARNERLERQARVDNARDALAELLSTERAQEQSGQ